MRKLVATVFALLAMATMAAQPRSTANDIEVFYRSFDATFIVALQRNGVGFSYSDISFKMNGCAVVNSRYWTA